MGRPTKLTDKIKPIIELLARRGFTDKEIAKVVDIKEQTLTNWKKAHPDFFASLKEAKIDSDGKVQKSLYEMACGFEGPDGRYYPPNPTAIIFWLKNRQPDKWRDKREHAVSGDLKIELVDRVK